jgi:hypothetical protein
VTEILPRPDAVVLAANESDPADGELATVRSGSSVRRAGTKLSFTLPGTGPPGKPSDGTERCGSAYG